MPVESATYISQLDVTKPAGSDAKAEGDDQLRLLKSTVKATFPNFTAAPLNATQAQIDKLVTSVVADASAPANAVIVNASGNMGIGGSPSAWGGANKAVDIGTIGSLAADAETMRVVNNAYADASGNFRYKSSAPALTYIQNRAVGHAWGFAGSGAKDAIITFTQVMTIDINGNLIQPVPTTPPSLATNGALVMNLTSNTNLRISVRGSDGVTRMANITLA